MDYELIIFDCDGTLINSEVLYNKVTSDLLIETGLSEYTTQKCVEEFAGTTWGYIKDTIEQRHDLKLPADTIEKYIQRTNEEIGNVLNHIDGAMDFVDLSSARVKICVGSNGERNNVIKSLVHHGFDKYFTPENTFTCNQVPNAKPAPDLFLFAAEKMDVDPAKCLVIEDSPTGAAAGVAAGMDVFGFTGAAHDAEIQKKKLLDVGVKAVYEDFIHMAEVLGY